MEKDLHIPQQTSNPRTPWDALSIQEKSEMMRTAIDNGILKLSDIKDTYNEFAEGGSTKDDDLVDWIIKEEGFNTKPEDIGDGKMTLGSGLTAQKWHDLYKRRGNKWSQADNRKAVAEEVANRRRRAEKNIPNWDSMPESSQKALLSYKYNYDFTPANSPKLFQALKDSDLREAARQMDATSKNSKFKKGLSDRRKREQEWFLSGLPSYTPPTLTSYEVPMSTAVYNPYNTYRDNTVLVPQMVPDSDSYVTAHPLTEGELKARKFQEHMDAIENFNNLMQLVGIQNNPIPSFVSTNPLSSLINPSYSEGGSIHIKPENKGKFTALKKRTGHSATWFKKHGTPAQKKMAVFALNARKWKHDEGGNLYDGNSQDSQQLVLGKKFWQQQEAQPQRDYLAEIVEYNRRKEAERQQRVATLRRELAVKGEQIAKKRQKDYLTMSNDNTWVERNNGREKNPHLTERAVEGAKAHAAWAEEHPVMNAIGLGLGAAPFTVASVPVIGAAVESAPAVASALAPGSAFWTNPITQQVTASTLGGTALNATSEVTTGKTWDEHTNETIEGLTGWNPESGWYGGLVTGLFNPGYYTPYGAIAKSTAKAIEGVSPINRAVKNYADNVERRGAETVMRTTPLANPLPEAWRGLKSMWNGEIGGKQRLAHIADYVLTGRRVGPKGYYNSLAGYYPTNLANLVKHPNWREKWDAFKHPTGITEAYSGFVNVSGRVPRMTERDDIIDALLYGKDIDPSFGLKKLSVGKDFGPHTEYVASKYATKAKDIPVYEMNTPEGIETASPVGEWKGVDNGLFDGGNGDFLNVAGHIGTKGVTPEGVPVVKKQDIWKFNPEEYYPRWLENKRTFDEKTIEEMPSWLQKGVKWGLKEVDRLGTPVITRTKWDKWSWL